MTFRTIALACSVAAVLGLSACDDGDQSQDTSQAEPAEQSSAQQAAPQEAPDEATDEAPAEAPADGAGQSASAGADASGASSATAPQDMNGPVQEPEAEDAADAEKVGEVDLGDGSPALAAIAGKWARSQDQCEAQALTISETAVSGPKGDCEVKSSDVKNGVLTIELSCDGRDETWSVDGSQDEAKPRNVTLDRGAGERVDLERCETLP